MSDITIIEKKKEINLLLEQFTSVNKSYINNLRTGNKEESAKDLALLDKLNSLILTHMSENEGILSSNYSKGIKQQEMVNKNNEKFKDIKNKLNEERKRIKMLMQEEHDLEGTEQFWYQNMTSYKYKYLYYIICAIILIILIIRAFISSDTGLIDTVIAVSAFMLLIYHYIPTLTTLTIGTLKKYILKFLKF